MKMKIIALAVAAAFSAPAFADVTPYGIVDGAIANVSATGQKSDLLAISGGASTSRIGVKATEDLGEGLTGIAVLEFGLDTETNQQTATTPTVTTTVNGTAATPAFTGATATSTSTGVTASNLAARQQLLGVAGSFGTIATGYLQTVGYDFESKFDPLAGSSASPLQSVTKGGAFLIGTAGAAVRAQRAVAYISPDMSGLKFAVNYTTSLDNNLGNLKLADAATTGLKTTAYLLAANYDAGPLALGAVYVGTSNASTGAATATEWSLGGSYDLGVAKLLATYQSKTTTPAAPTASFSDTAMSLSAVVPVGANAVAVSYASNTMKAANSNGSGYTVGYLHTLSKTTTAYAAYAAVSNGTATNAYSVDNNAVAGGAWAAGGSSSLIGFGLRKKF